MSVQPEAQTVMTLALGLQAQDRALLAAQLISSLDDGQDVDADRAWDREIQERHEAYKSGASLISWTEVQTQMGDQLRR